MLEVPDATLDALERVEDIIAEALDDDTQVGRLAVRTVKAGGKRLRPLLVLLSFQAAGGLVDERILRLAAAVELIHTASLVHDDVIDEATLRRGEPSIYQVYGTSKAIVVGDYLFVKGYALAAECLDATATRRVEEACRHLAEGQFAEEDLKADAKDTERYLYVVERKTASLIAACSELGAYMAGVRGAALEPYRAFGFNLGVAFQLIDDVLDVTGSVATLGKDVGNDTRNGAKGGPAVFALQAEHAHFGQAMKQMLASKGVEATKGMAEAFAQRSHAAVTCFPPSAYADTLGAVAKVLLHRDR